MKREDIKNAIFKKPSVKTDDKKLDILEKNAASPSKNVAA